MGARTPAIHNRGELVARLVDLAQSATVEQVRDAAVWYNEYNSFCHEIAAVTPLTVPQVCGIVAALSPETEWNLNKEVALELINAFVVGEEAPPAGLPQYPPQVDKAWRIAGLTGDDKADELLIGNIVSKGRLKTWDFYWSGLLREWACCIDRHAYHAAVGRPVVGGVKAKEYKEIHAAYIEAAAICGYSVYYIFQALCWVVIRGKSF